jgi:hypothetical protein
VSAKFNIWSDIRFTSRLETDNREEIITNRGAGIGNGEVQLEALRSQSGDADYDLAIYKELSISNQGLWGSSQLGSKSDMPRYIAKSKSDTTADESALF